MPRQKQNTAPDPLLWSRQLERDRIAAALGQPVRPATPAPSFSGPDRSDDEMTQQRWRSALERDRAEATVMTRGLPFPGPGAGAADAIKGQLGGDQAELAQLALGDQSAGEKAAAAAKILAKQAIRRAIIAALPFLAKAFLILTALFAVYLAASLVAFCWNNKLDCARDFGPTVLSAIGL